MKNIISAFIFVFIYFAAFSQTSQPNLEIVTTAGDYYVGQGITLSWTLGEPVIETFVSTDKSVTLTQGFQQPNTGSGYSISGKVIYDNSLQTPMAKTKVYLINSESQKIDSSLTDSLTNTGYYSFTNIPDGNYSLTCSTTQPWRHANPGDALIVNRNYIGEYALTSFVKKAGDVNNDDKVNPGDALVINRRYINVLHKYSIPDWLFQQTNVTINGSSVTQNILAICAADMKAQYVPPDKKISQDVSLTNNGIMLVSDNVEFELPVMVTRDITFGAIGLVITYPTNNIDIKGVTSNIPGLIYNIADGEVRVAWTDLKDQGISLKNNDTLIRLNAIASNLKSNNEMMLSLNSECVLVDNDTNTLSGEELNIPRIVLQESLTSGFLSESKLSKPVQE